MSDVSDALQKMNLGGLLGDGLREPTNPSPAPWEAPLIDDLKGVFSRYEIVRLIGRGGMGAVYEARQLDLDRHVAIKVLPVELGANEAFAERFRREARALGRLRHPNILEVYEFGESTAGHLYFTMEYLPGGDLGTRLKNGLLPPGEALRIVKEICGALEAAHAQGVIHRDIKPSNILLTASGTVKVADFGLAVLADRPEERFTHTGVAMGTFEYASPEQVSGTAVDSRSDLYSVGVLCYELLTGKLPRGVFDPPSKVAAAVKPEVDEVVQTALQNDPDRRYQTASDLRTALHQSETAPIRPKPRRRKWGVLGSAILLGAAVAATIHWWPSPSSSNAKIPRNPTVSLPPGRPLIPEEVELEKLFTALESPAATTADARKWAAASESTGLAVTRQFDGDNSALIHYTTWISRLEQKRAAAPNDPRWMVALAATFNRQANILRGTDPTLGLKTFELALALYRNVLKKAPEDSQARWDVVTSLCKVLDTHQVYSSPSVLLAACREAITVCADLPDRRAGEEWFDQYLGNSTAISLQRAQSGDATLRPQVQAAAQAALHAIFERPGADPTALTPVAAAARQALQELAK